MSHRVMVFVPDGVVPLDLVVPLDVFGPWPSYVSASMPSGGNPYQLSLVSEGGGRCGPWLTAATEGLDALESADTIVVPGTLTPDRPQPRRVLDAIARQRSRGARIVSICTGAFILGDAGLLEERRATTHWFWAPELQRMHPRAVIDADRLYVDDGDILTSAGVLAGADLCLHVLRRDLGQRVSNTMARYLVSPPHRDGGQSQYAAGEPPFAEDSLGAVQRWIDEHLDEALTLEMLARQAHTSVRSLSRRFRANTGSSVMDWVASRRLAAARDLLESSDAAMEEIALRCGFGTTESMRLHFARQLGTTPSRYRRTFAAF